MKHLSLFAVPVALVLGISAVAVFAEDKPLVAKGFEIDSSTVRPPAKRPTALPFHKGIGIFWADDPKDRDDIVRFRAQRVFRYLRTLNANAVSITFPFVMNGPRSSRVTADRIRTPTPDRLEIVLSEAVRYRIQATIRPTLDEQTLRSTNDWRGSITPTDRDVWFASYQSFLLPYLDAAEKWRAAAFAVGVELNTMEGDSRWNGLFTEAERHFTGVLGHDQNFDQFRRKRMIKHALGLDLYPELKLPDTATAAEVTSGLNAWLNLSARGPQPQLVISETGVPAADGAYRLPYTYNAAKPVNEQVQVNWFKAVCALVKAREMAGVYWWNVDFDGDPKARNRSNSYVLTGRPEVEAVIRDCFR
ncbi:MAG: hypothetical protein ABIS86_03430 [Streptosporangiaceae bacterium]